MKLLSSDSQLLITKSTLRSYVNNLIQLRASSDVCIPVMHFLTTLFTVEKSLAHAVNDKFSLSLALIVDPVFRNLTSFVIK
jgi:hypothetical protein